MTENGKKDQGQVEDDFDDKTTFQTSAVIHKRKADHKYKVFSVLQNTLFCKRPKLR